MCGPATKSKPTPPRASTPVKVLSHFPEWSPAVLLVLVTISLYWLATHNDFVNYDDDIYVTANRHVQAGLTLAGLKWAFFKPDVHLGYWHPLTLLTHMLDCQLYGLKPWGHHLTSVLLHALNTVLVFVLLRSLTGAVWRSAVVAALFAVHPLHVESVAWVAERKDLVSGCFGLLTIIFYVRYARQFKIQDSKFKINYWLALAFFGCGLMSKPMLVTWPFVLLLLDYWPLGRWRTADGGVRSQKKSAPQMPGMTKRSGGSVNSQLSICRLVGEKIPFFVLTTVTSVVTFVVQKQ